MSTLTPDEAKAAMKFARAMKAQAAAKVAFKSAATGPRGGPLSKAWRDANVAMKAADADLWRLIMRGVITSQKTKGGK